VHNLYPNMDENLQFLLLRSNEIIDDGSSSLLLVLFKLGFGAMVFLIFLLHMYTWNLQR
jgi:hypothetical protein